AAISHRPHSDTAPICRESLQPAEDSKMRATTETSHQPALLDGGGNEACKQRMRIERARFQFRMILHADEPGMVRVFNRLWQQTVRRQAGKAKAAIFEPFAIACIDLIAVAVALG